MVGVCPAKIKQQLHGSWLLLVLILAEFKSFTSVQEEPSHCSVKQYNSEIWDIPQTIPEVCVPAPAPP